MIFSAIANRLNKKLYRRKYRRMLQQWEDDGGDEKLRYDYYLNSNSFVMDLGGYEGEWTENIHQKFGCQVAIFEPVRKFAEKIKNKFSQNEAIKICQYGLGSSSRTDTIYLWGAGTSTFRKRAKAEEIRIVDIKKWFSDHNMQSVQLMKINIEGGEFDLFTDEVISAFSESSFIIEIHDFKFDDGKNKRKALIDSFKDFDVEMVKSRPKQWSDIDQITALSDNDRALVCSEGRRVLGEWLVATPRKQSMGR